VPAPSLAKGTGGSLTRRFRASHLDYRRGGIAPTVPQVAVQPKSGSCRHSSRGQTIVLCFLWSARLRSSRRFSPKGWNPEAVANPCRQTSIQPQRQRLAFEGPASQPCLDAMKDLESQVPILHGDSDLFTSPFPSTCTEVSRRSDATARGNRRLLNGSRTNIGPGIGCPDRSRHTTRASPGCKSGSDRE
jgi:hypothetical protein